MSYISLNRNLIIENLKKSFPGGVIAAEPVYNEKKDAIEVTIRYQLPNGARDLKMNYPSDCIHNWEEFRRNINADLAFMELCIISPLQGFNGPVFRLDALAGTDGMKNKDGTLRQRYVKINGTEIEGEQYDKVYNSKTGVIDTKYLYENVNKFRGFGVSGPDMFTPTYFIRE
jgi:hypothetical protein